jgi:hypothetical protein
MRFELPEQDPTKEELFRDGIAEGEGANTITTNGST